MYKFDQFYDSWMVTCSFRGVAQFLGNQKCLRDLYFPQKGLTTLMREKFLQTSWFSRNNTELSRWIWAHPYVISMDPAPTSKNYSHLERRLIDMPHIFSESLDNSEQNLHRCILNLFLKFFWVGPLYKKKNIIKYFYRIQIKVGKHDGNKCIAFDVWSDKEWFKIL